MPNVKYKDSKEFKAGQLVMPEDMEEILGLYPDSTNDPNDQMVLILEETIYWPYRARS